MEPILYDEEKAFSEWKKEIEENADLLSERYAVVHRMQGHVLYICTNLLACAVLKENTQLSNYLKDSIFINEYGETQQFLYKYANKLTYLNYRKEDSNKIESGNCCYVTAKVAEAMIYGEEIADDIGTKRTLDRIKSYLGERMAEEMLMSISI